MCLWRAPETYIAGAALDRAALVYPTVIMTILVETCIVMWKNS
jgi:hypothetical protein